MRQRLFDLLHYISIASGMALAGACYSMVGQLLNHGALAQVLIGIGMAALICIVISSAVAELAARYPSMPGIRTYLRGAFGDSISLVFTYTGLLVVVLFAGLETQFLLKVFFPGISKWMGHLFITFVILAIASVNLLSIELSKRAQIIITVVLIGGSIFLSTINVSNQASVLAIKDGSNWINTFEIIGLSIFLFMGFEWVTPMGRNRQAYERMIPLSMIISILLLACVYALFSLAASRHMPASGLTSNLTPHLTLSAIAFGSAGKAVAMLLTILAMLSTLNAGLMGASRLLYVLAREKSLFINANQFCASLSKDGTPRGAILAISITALTLAQIQYWLDLYTEIGVICAALYCCLYAAFLFAATKLRRIAPKKGLFGAYLPSSLLIVIGCCLPLLAFATLFYGPAPSITAQAIFMLAITLPVALVSGKKYLSPSS